MTVEEYLKENPRAAIPTFHGERADQGRIVIGDYPESYAVLRCGNTEVQISYTLLRNLTIDQPPASSHLRAPMEKLQRAIYAIACEASLGRTG